MQPLSVVAKIDGGYAFKSEAFSDIGVPVIRISNINEGRVNLKETARVPESFLKDFSAFRLNPCDILIAMSGATTGKIGVVPSDINEPLLLNQRVGRFKILDHKKLDQSYLRFIAESNNFQTQIQLLAAGAAQSNISGKQIESIQIPLPPLEVQKKIAAVLEKADALRRKREEQIKRLDDLLQATFLDMFGDPVTNPKGWPMQKFGNCISNIRSGWSAKAENRPAVGNEYGVFKISAVTTGRFIKSENKYVKNIDSKRVLIIPQKGDLLFSRANTRELVAAVCLVEEDCKNLFLPDKLWKIEALENTSTKEFLRYVIMDPGIHEKITTKATGTSGSMLNVSQQKFLSVDLPLPPFQLQKFFSSLFWKTIEQRKRLDAAFNLIKSNFNSLMQRAFKGELELK
ncbi:MAG TPA: restriction endonuclease subunit S [Candidatus Rifleibacterium sp.]|nr:restriction endonuclease subunit S [Candidatus Rifleibacterium sp.]